LVIDEGLFLIKPNLKEMGILAKNDNINIKTEKPSKSNKCKAVVISLGADGALLVTEKFSEHYLAPKTVLKSTVGAGDSMLLV